MVVGRQGATGNGWASRVGKGIGGCTVCGRPAFFLFERRKWPSMSQRKEEEARTNIGMSWREHYEEVRRRIWS